MSAAVDLITNRVRERVRREGVDLAADSDLAHRFVREELRSYSERALGGTAPLIADEQAAARTIIAAVTGLGPLQPFLDDPTVEEVWINAPDRIFIARNGVSERIQLDLTEADVRDLVERMLRSTGRRVDLSSPFVDASLPDGSRLHVAIPDITRAHWAVNIRKFRSGMRDLRELVRLGSLSAQAAEFLHASVWAGLNILVSGATQSGKTTMLGALLASAPPEERIVTVEETFELALAAPDWVALQCRQASLEGTGEVNLRRLVKEALRMRPDRLVVGEVREAESLDLLIALNSGLPGMCSLHANSADDALRKLATLPLLAGRNIDASFVLPTVASSIDLVVHAELDRTGHRHVVEIVAPTGRVADGIVESTWLFTRTAKGLVATGALPVQREKLTRAGVDPADYLRTTK
ncbi:CpaF family protein [Pseudolysinimonas yzui]|uniref:Pilus assembly protein CpaF n=1 Tax=Pseudolysinimonas yzui TaxID=2708254 RepID=A0A8J3DU05_9MICO|nr:ATPase, T2SS/T4P/T4SS family [Pseudolysinimonas yzui]GHF04255.1 pilus assembly protein CpaF [Pseudolysinimonas yzui]